MRFLLSSVLGVGVALALFLLMHTLISGDRNRNRDSDDTVRLDFIQVDQDEIENIRKRTPPPKPEPPKKPPPPPKLAVDAADRPQQAMPDMQMPRIDLALGAGAIERSLILVGSRLIDIFLDDDTFAGKQLGQLGVVGIEYFTDPGLDLFRIGAIADLPGKCDFE